MQCIPYANQRQSQVRAVVMAFLKSHKGNEYDAIQASMACTDQWGITIDWHEFSAALDILHQQGEAEITRPGGYTRYLILKKHEEA